MALQFGVELELLLGGRKKQFSSWKALAEDVSKRLAKAGIPNHISSSSGSSSSSTNKSKPGETYREWAIVPEVTIPAQAAADGTLLHGIELVSPVYAAAGNWAADLAAIYGVLHGAYTVVPSPHCSTHVHVATNQGPLSEGAAVLLAEAALYYEQALDALMPPGRRGGAAYWCRSNRESHMFKVYGQGQEGNVAKDAAQQPPPLATCLDVVRHGFDTASFSVAEAVNLLPAECAYGRAHGKKRSFVHGKVFKWNFAGLPGVGTVEFRQPPGSVVADDACAWVTLALAFVAGALAGGGFQGNGNGDVGGASMQELWQVLQTGSLELGWEGGLGAVDDLFRGSSSGSDN